MPPVASAAGRVDAYESAVVALADALRGSADTLLLGHIGPDADTLGSALALGLGLQGLGLPVRVAVGEDDLVLPRSVAWLPGTELLEPAPAVRAGALPDLAVALDASSLERLGTLSEVFAASPVRAALDHHPSYTGFAALALVDAAAPATAVLTLDLLDRLGAELTPETATCLYAGLVTDTGAFRFPSTTPATHLVAARLIEAGVDHADVARRVFDEAPLAALRLLSAALERADLAEVGPGLSIVHTAVTRAERDGLGLPYDTAERVIEVVRTTAEAEVTLVTKQADDGRWHASLRSRGRVDVGDVAAMLGGGGHLFAAGFVTSGPQDALDAVVALLAARLPMA